MSANYLDFLQKQQTEPNVVPKQPNQLSYNQDSIMPFLQQLQDNPAFQQPPTTPPQANPIEEIMKYNPSTPVHPASTSALGSLFGIHNQAPAGDQLDNIINSPIARLVSRFARSVGAANAGAQAQAGYVNNLNQLTGGRPQIPSGPAQAQGGMNPSALETINRYLGNNRTIDPAQVQHWQDLSTGAKDRNTNTATKNSIDSEYKASALDLKQRELDYRKEQDAIENSDEPSKQLIQMRELQAKVLGDINRISIANTQVLPTAEPAVDSAGMTAFAEKLAKTIRTMEEKQSGNQPNSDKQPTQPTRKITVGKPIITK